MLAITEPGTIDDLVADADRAGYRVTPRQLRDWTEAGLLDYPRRRPQGKGHGSRPALYPANQRMLLLSLLHHRPTNGIPSLARIPVGIWIYWGDDYVPLRQARRAFMTWLRDARASKQKAQSSAKTILGQLDNPNASKIARQHLIGVLAEIAYTARADLQALEHAVREVFEPGAVRVQRAIGHPVAPITANSVVGLILARLEAASRLHAGTVTDDAFNDARQAHLRAFAEYTRLQPHIAGLAPSHLPTLYAEPATQVMLNTCCNDLLTVLGLDALRPTEGYSTS